ncbi:MAG: NADP-specific glutamate dehydrogenase [Promethearchaeota archaeon]
MSEEVHAIIERVKEKNPGEVEFHQAVREVLESLVPVVEKHPVFHKWKILDRIVEPERQVIFRVEWLDDNNEIMVNRGFRVQFNSAIGPYKGGLRFHPSVYLGIIKFLGFEQIFKNSLTGLPMGGGKGGSDFDPKGKSDYEVMKFCQSFMGELFRHIGRNVDVPAGDIGVGSREIGYLYGQYRKITNRFEGALTGKAIEWGGSLIRPEATGYGATFFAREILKVRGEDFKGKKVAISGSGNVAQYATEKVNQLGGKVVTLSDSNGYIHDPDGIEGKKFQFLLDLKQVRRGRIKEYADEFNVDYFPNQRPWGVEVDLAMPCATQNEIELEDAQKLVDNGVIAVVEGANMPTTIEATDLLRGAGVVFAPGKAANAGGVAVSGLEISQNNIRLLWSRRKVERMLEKLMVSIHATTYETSKEYGRPGDYLMGANAAGFLKVARAMIDQGVL